LVLATFLKGRSLSVTERDNPADRTGTVAWTDDEGRFDGEARCEEVRNGVHDVRHHVVPFKDLKVRLLGQRALPDARRKGNVPEH
jgi:hypothetical protein